MASVSLMPSGWTVCYEDTNGVYMKCLDPTAEHGRRYHFIRWDDNMEDMGERGFKAHKAQGGGRYSVSLRMVDLLFATPAMIARATQSCGWDGMGNGPDAVADVLFNYGNTAPLWDLEGSNLKKLLAEARRESKQLIVEGHEEAMTRTVNKLGSTALEYMVGDTLRPVCRGVAQGSDTAGIAATMYKMDLEQAKAAGLQELAGGSAVVFQVRQQGGPSPDPLAFAAGFSDGLAAQVPLEPRHEISPEYFRGFTTGLQLRLGEVKEPPPEILNLKQVG